jgi:DNA-binding CsgD family transcriptional regulator
MLAVTLGIAWARQGDARSRVCLDEALERARESGVRGWVLSVLPASAEAHWLAGDLASAQADLAAVVEAFDGDLPAAAIEVAAWCRRVGMEEPAIRGPRTGHPTHLLLAGDWAAAAAGFDGLGMPYEAALACHDSGSAVGLRDALHRFEQLGATAAVGATRRQMRRLGVRVGTTGQRAATRAHPLGLTRREAEVLDGITAGDTNAQIAERLFLSARTVDHHVSSLLSKLGVESRAEAVRVAAQYGSALGQN